MSDRVVFSIDSYVWQNQRKSIRLTGITGLWYKAIGALLKILHSRAGKLSWLYRQFWLESSDGPGLIAWGVRYKINQRPGESTNDYKNRIILERLFKLSVPSVSTKIQVLLSITGFTRPQINYLSIYKSELGKNLIKMGEDCTLPIMSRDYIKYRYRFYIPNLPESFDRIQLVNGMENVNVGGNVPEIWEDAGELDPFIMGGDITGKMLSRRVDKTREVLVY